MTASSSTRFGLSVALSTPINQAGLPDLARMVDHAKWCIAGGCDSVTVFGTTGEGASAGVADRAAALGALSGAGLNPGRQLLVGIAAASLADAVEQARVSLDMGVRGLLLAPPFYFKGVSDDGLFAWFSRFIEALKGDARGIILYHIPSVTAVGLSPKLIRRIRDAFPGVIAGVKDSSGDWSNTQALLAEHADMAVLVGDERHLAAAVQKGGQGTICGVANVAPSLLRPLVYEGRHDTRIDAIVNLICSHPVLPAVKGLIAHRTGDEGWLAMRAPLEPMTMAEAKTLGAAFDRLVEAKAA